MAAKGIQAPQEVADFIRAHGRFIILGHKEPDGDCISSQLAFAHLLEQLGKEHRLVSAGPFDRPEIAPYEGLFARDVDEGMLAGAVIVILDCSTPDRTGEPGEKVAGLPTLVIDHHSSGEVFGDVRFVVPTAPSSTLLVLAIVDLFGFPLTAAQAQLILFGLCTDTGFFRHLGHRSDAVFLSIARLVEAGTSTAEVYHMVHGRRDLASRKLLATMLQRTESHLGDRLLVSWQTVEDRARLGGNLRGDDDLYRLLQTVKDNEVVAFIKEEEPERFSVGLRSNRDVDVGAIAASFGGGGHRQAAGCDMRGTLESVKKTVIEALVSKLQL